MSGLERPRSAARRYQSALSVLSLCVKGGVERLVEHRASVEGPDSNVPENMLRFSIGIESVDELIADREQALQTLGQNGAFYLRRAVP